MTHHEKKFLRRSNSVAVNSGWFSPPLSLHLHTVVCDGNMCSNVWLWLLLLVFFYSDTATHSSQEWEVGLLIKRVKLKDKGFPLSGKLFVRCQFQSSQAKCFFCFLIHVHFLYCILLNPLRFVTHNQGVWVLSYLFFHNDGDHPLLLITIKLVYLLLTFLNSFYLVWLVKLIEQP